MKKLNYAKKVTIPLDELALLCLNVDYGIRAEARDAVEDLSLELQKQFKFDTNKFRQFLKKVGINGV